MAVSTHPELDEAGRALRGLARDFAEKTLAPGAAERDRTCEFPLDLYKGAGELGLLGIHFPEKLGGGGAGHFENQLVLEELSRVDGSFALTVGASAGLTGGHILGGGSEEQIRRWVPRLLEGELGAWALTEPGSGSDAGALRCRAEREGDSYILNGTKMFISQGTIFSAMTVMARTGRGKKEISAFVVEPGDPGRVSRPLHGKLGMRSMDTAEVIFENCRIPADRLLGGEGEGFVQAMEAVTGGRVGVGAIAVGLAQGALDAATGHAREREAFGGPIAQYGAIREMLAESVTELAAARELVAHAARLRDAGEEYQKEASMAKLFATEAALRVCDRSIQIHGGYGYMDECPAGHFWRDARLLTIGEGTSEVQRMIIARSVSGGRV